MDPVSADADRSTPKPTKSITESVDGRGVGDKGVNVPAEGVAKLTFNLLEELHGDSSLEPGEVKTPPRENSPAVGETVQRGVRKESALAKSVLRSVSQLETDACKEKVRAILELDAIQRRAEAERRKSEIAKKRFDAGEGDAPEDETQRRAKKERKRLKRLQKEQKEKSNAESGEAGNEKEQQREKKTATLSDGDSYDSERFYSISHTSSEKGDCLVSNLSGTASSRFSCGLTTHPGMPPFPDYMAFRPFMRGHTRPFHTARGRGALRGNLRFPSFRPQFFGNASARFSTPTQSRQHTPPPARGHSPIKTPQSDLMWTKTKPSLSYAFKSQLSKTRTVLKTDTVAAPETEGDGKATKGESPKKSRLFKNVTSTAKKKKSKKTKTKKLGKKRNSDSPRCKATSDGRKSRMKSKMNISSCTRSNSKPTVWPVEPESRDITSPLDLMKVDVKIKPATDELLHNNDKCFDIFADSPPPLPEMIERLPKSSHYDAVAPQNDGARTPPLSLVERNAKFQSLLEVQKRVVQLLQDDDDLDLEATQKKLLQKTKRQGCASMVLKRASRLIENDAEDFKLTATKDKLEQPTKPSHKAVTLNNDVPTLWDNECKTKRQDNDTTVPQKNLESVKDDLVYRVRKVENTSVDLKRVKRLLEEDDDISLELPREKVIKTKSSIAPTATQVTESKNKTWVNDNARPHRNPFRVPECKSPSPTLVGAKSREQNNKQGSMNRSKRSSSRNRTFSPEPRSTRHRDDSNRNHAKTLLRQSSEKRVMPASLFNQQKETNKSIEKVNPPKVKKGMPLSFAVSEFHFPEAETEVKGTKPKHLNRVVAQSMYKDDSLDTDDYQDNWENDDDLSTNVQVVRSSEENQSPLSRFVNPSPPKELLQVKQKELLPTTEQSRTPKASAPSAVPALQSSIRNDSSTDESLGSPLSRFVNPSPPRNVVNMKQQVNFPHLGESTTPPTSLKACSSKKTAIDGAVAKAIGVKSMDSSGRGELFAMQEIYDQFIKSVEDSGVEVTGGQQLVVKIDTPRAEDGPKPTESYKSTSPTSSSSSFSSSTATSLSNSATSSEESGNEDHSLRSELSSSQTTWEAEKHSSANKTDNHESIESQVEAPPSITAESPKKKQQIGVPAKAQKSSVAKDFKKLQSLESNLSRIQSLLANYDSTDDFNEELFKMEKLFLQQKNLILQKYAKSSSSESSGKTSKATVVLQESESNDRPAEGELSKDVTALNQSLHLSSEADKIFDSNREAIKLKISPIKLTRPTAPAIFSASLTEEAKPRLSGQKAEGEETDFTEKLKVKPPKEVAIVKPIMESKESRESKDSKKTYRHRHSPSGYRERERDHDRPRRSESRSRVSQTRRSGRHHSSSVSPGRRRQRTISPQRRSGNRSRKIGSRRSWSRSRSRSPSRLPSKLSPGRRRSHANPPHRRSPRPHSPRSPLVGKRRRSYSRERFSRSPLPFRPPSPPTRRGSHSPPRRPRSLSPRRGRTTGNQSPSRSPRKPRSPAPHRSDSLRSQRRRSHSYEQRSLSPQQVSYYDPDHVASSYYFDMSPIRFRLDSQLVPNGPVTGQDGVVAAQPVVYEQFEDYGDYGGSAYMTAPPQMMPDVDQFYANQYVPIPGSSSAPPHTYSHSMYSNIPTISEATAPAPAFYYNEYESGEGGTGVHHHQTASLLKELPKATVAVQKGNVLEIVPSSEISAASEGSEAATVTLPEEPKKPVTISWRLEVRKRHALTANLRSKREKDGLRSILRRTDTLTEEAVKHQKDERQEQKKVFFEDGIFPDKDSDEEDRKVVCVDVRRRLRRSRRRLNTVVPGINLAPIQIESVKVDPELEKLPAPPPPPGLPHSDLPQPVYMRSYSPVPLLYFHYDRLVNSMYYSPCETPMPPRLRQKSIQPHSSIATPAAHSPSHIKSPTMGLGTNPHLSKKEFVTISVVNRANRSDRASPLAIPTVQRHELAAAVAAAQSQQIVAAIAKPTFQPITTEFPQRPPPPVVFASMRFNSFPRLPPSPLARAIHQPSTRMSTASPIPVLGVRSAYSVPPPAMMVPSSAPPAIRPQINDFVAPTYTSVLPSFVNVPPPVVQPASVFTLPSHQQHLPPPSFLIPPTVSLSMPPPPVKNDNAPLLNTVGILSSDHKEESPSTATVHSGDSLTTIVPYQVADSP